MEEGRLVIRFSGQEKKILKETSSKFGFNVSEYVKRKLFHENEDLVQGEEKYISPYPDKNNLVIISELYKIFYMVKKLLKQNGLNAHEVTETEKHSLEYARRERKRYGYKHIGTGNE